MNHKTNSGENKILKKYGLTIEQMRVLVIAARHWKTLESNEIHDGEVTMVGLNQTSSNALFEKGLIMYDFVYPHEIRIARQASANELINGAFTLAQITPPLALVELADTSTQQTAWKVVLNDLKTASEMLTSCEAKVIRITEAGKHAVSAWKMSIPTFIMGELCRQDLKRIEN